MGITKTEDSATIGTTEYDIVRDASYSVLALTAGPHRLVVELDADAVTATDTFVLRLRASVNAHRKARGEADMDALTFLKLCRTEMKALGMADDVLQRSVNAGFSGGEKKRFEILHMTLLQPSLCILDETDSGLDIDALRIVANGVNRLRAPNRSFIIITHYQRLLDYITPDHVHILANPDGNGGRIVQSGGPELAKKLEESGYEGVIG